MRPGGSIAVTRPASQVEAVEWFAKNVLIGGQKRWCDSLQLVVQVMAATGGIAWLVETGVFRSSKSAPEPLLAHGEGALTSDPSKLFEYLRDFCVTRSDGQECSAAITQDSSPFACAVAPLSYDLTLGVIICGDAQSRFEDLSLLRAFALLLAYAVRESGEHTRVASRLPATLRTFPQGYLVGPSEAINALHREVETLSRGDFSVLIVGETGVGKEHLARLIHVWSGHSKGPFIAVNCAAIPADLLEAELFGIARGVATGVYEREGYFKLADGGTLFLDEIGELPLPSQAKLLRVLQDGEVRRVGGTVARIDVRVIAATNADLRRRMADGSFRPDLYYRLAGFQVCVPALRDRKEDIPVFMQHYVQAFCRQAGKTVGGVTSEALGLLTDYPWPGNIRELENEIRRLVYTCPSDGFISPDLLPTYILFPTCREEEGEESLSNPLLLEPHLKELEKRLILEALARSHDNYSRAAKLLGISRNGLAIKMQRLGIRS